MLPLRADPGPSHVVATWKSSLPFVENSRADLIHRPRSVTVYQIGNRPPHIAIGYWCGNHASGKRNFTFLNEPERDALLCMFCEAKAKAAKLPSAEEICGRHVHIGRMLPVQTCCDAALAEVKL